MRSSVSTSESRWAVGDIVPPCTLTTIRGDQIHVPSSDRVVHLQFRRFAACPICNVHLRSVASRHDEITSAGIREVVVFHSPAEAMLPHQGQLPFAAIADPEQRLYAQFGVESSPRANLHPRVWTSPLKWQSWSVVLRTLRAGGKLGSRGESMLGLPADFLIDPGGRVIAVKYGNHANDQWSVDELLDLARYEDPIRPRRTR